MICLRPTSESSDQVAKQNSSVTSASLSQHYLDAHLRVYCARSAEVRQTSVESGANKKLDDLFKDRIICQIIGVRLRDKALLTTAVRTATGTNS